LKNIDVLSLDCFGFEEIDLNNFQSFDVLAHCVLVKVSGPVVLSTLYPLYLSISGVCLTWIHRN